MHVTSDDKIVAGNPERHVWFDLLLILVGEDGNGIGTVPCPKIHEDAPILILLGYSMLVSN